MVVEPETPEQSEDEDLPSEDESVSSDSDDSHSEDSGEDSGEDSNDDYYHHKKPRPSKNHHKRADKEKKNRESLDKLMKLEDHLVAFAEDNEWSCEDWKWAEETYGVHTWSQHDPACSKFTYSNLMRSH